MIRPRHATAHETPWRGLFSLHFLALPTFSYATWPTWAAIRPVERWFASGWLDAAWANVGEPVANRGPGTVLVRATTKYREFLAELAGCVAGREVTDWSGHRDRRGAMQLSFRSHSHDNHHPCSLRLPSAQRAVPH
jgi:hypothetical protein